MEKKLLYSFLFFLGFLHTNEMSSKNLSDGNIPITDSNPIAPFTTLKTNCAPTTGVTDFEGLYTTFTELISATGSATATVECFDITSETLNSAHTARVAGTSVSGNELIIIQGVGTSPNANLARTIIKSNDGSEFNFQSIKVQPFGTFTDWDITYVGYKDGSTVPGAVLTRNNMVTATMYTDNFSAITAFENVDEIRIEFSVVGTSFQNFRIDDIEISAVTLHTEEVNAPFQFSMYPNPSSHVLYVKSQYPDDFQIIDMFGKKVHTFKVNAQTISEIPMDALRNGMYFMRSKNTNYTYKLVVNKP